MLQIRFMSLRQWSGPFVEIWIGDYFLAEGRLDSFEEHPGRSIEVTTDEMVYNIRDIVEIVGISFECVQHILHEYLGMTKPSAI
jgi:hypothetical protein